MEKLNRIRGSLIGGAVGDALGYAVEFYSAREIFDKYGPNGITSYKINPLVNKAVISDDTQMTLFTANGILINDTRHAAQNMGIVSSLYDLKFWVHVAYKCWYRTQTMSYEEYERDYKGVDDHAWLCDVPSMFARRAPGMTCLNALSSDEHYSTNKIANDSKGCGGIMRVAPLGFYAEFDDIEKLDKEGAELAALTHGHSLGYMPAAMLVHIINRIAYPVRGQSLEDIVLDSKDAINRIFDGDKNLPKLNNLVDLAMELAGNSKPDLTNIKKLGEGWVAEETLAIAIYCALRYRDDFSRGIIASVNHDGDSDSTGAVTGNILGAYLGIDAIDQKWISDLEMVDVIEKIARDLDTGARVDANGEFTPEWREKYARRIFF